jgi:hypothetical protein
MLSSKHHIVTDDEVKILAEVCNDFVGDDTTKINFKVPLSIS